MKTKKLLLSSALLLLLTACGGGAQDVPQKPLFSTWIGDANGLEVDLSMASFAATRIFQVRYADGSQCQCNIYFSGTELAGDLAVHACYHPEATSDQDPGCFAKGGAASYTNEHGVLSIESSEGVAIFR